MGASAKPKQQEVEQVVVVVGDEEEEEEEEEEGKRIKLKKGTVVEVSTDEEGFKDAWFVATVIEPPPPPPPPPPSKAKKNPSNHPQQNREAYVQYKTLCADENLSKPLRERVPLRFIRPVPPVDKNPPPFQLHDIVDAFYRDGWWTGVITRLLHSSSRFVVTFRSPPDDIEFGLSDLRHHLDWVNGSWVRPSNNQRISGVMYRVGDTVEVSLEKEDVWFPADVVEVLGNDSLVVQYQTYHFDHPPKLHRVTVGCLNVRPPPPVVKDRKNFVLFDKVEAFCGFAWRGGVITKELADSRYIVFFKQTKKEAEFNHSELRPPLSWKDGKWFNATQDVIGSFPADLLRSEPKDTSMDVSCRNLTTSGNNSQGKKVEKKPPLASKQRDDKNEEMNSDHQSLPNKATALEKRTDNTPSDSGKMLLQPLEKLKSGSDAAVKSVIMCHQKRIGSEKQTEGKVSSSDSRPSSSSEANVQAVSLGQPSDNPSLQKKTHRKHPKIDAEENSVWSSKKKTGTTVKLLFKKSQTSPTRLGCIKVSGSRAGETHKLLAEERVKVEGNQNCQMNDPSVHNKVLQAVHGTQKRKRGRPRKLSLSCLQTPATEQNGNNAECEAIVKDCVKNEVDSLKTAAMVSMSVEESAGPNGDANHVKDNQPTQKNESGKTMQISAVRVPTEKNDQALKRQHEKYSSKKAKRRLPNVSQNSSVEDSSDVSERKASESKWITKEVKLVVDRRTDDMLDDQPLSKWFEGRQSPSNVDGARIFPATEQSTEFSKRQKVAAQTPSVDDGGTTIASKEIVTGCHSVDNGAIVLISDENLPFKKNTTLWAAVESMEVFRKMPQKPHFQPLQMYKESSREGLAIACMVTFSSAVERIAKLQFDDPSEMIDDILDSLNDLESHGFDVQGLRDRIDVLLSIKVDNKKLDGETAEIESQISNCHLDKENMDKDIDGIRKQIAELQDKLAEAESVKKVKDAEIASLESELTSIQESLSSARKHFEELAAGVL